MTSQEENHPAVTVAAVAADSGAASTGDGNSASCKADAAQPAVACKAADRQAPQEAAPELPVACAADNAHDAARESWTNSDGSETNSSYDTAVSAATAKLEEAQKMYEKAAASVANGLPLCNDWLRARDLFFEAGALFGTCGHADSAARAFLHASVIADAFKNEGETISMLSMAADNLQVVHPACAVEVLNFLSASFAKSGLIIQAARCKREAAELLEYRLDMPAQAIEAYKAAMQLFGTRPVTKSFSRSCMERICALTVTQMRFTEAAELYLEEAKMVQRSLPKTRQFLYCLLCLLADGCGNEDRYFDALYITRKKFDALQEEEKNFQQGKEYALVRHIIEANDHGSLNEFDVAVFTYKSCATFKQDAAFDVLIERCRANLYEHLDQYM
ncbi:uncharacterized protein Tco025E_05864 [Trypanosoma conorhini]|uniref:Uncharacterized protein n=1 Tax=Trypanosoma conorhini TaxID=83891 RepID=A0A422PA08_9TRYP|nr:uncharacterized protein Tco025E_05864 [Trypanosoma conorhini]RNF14556.1 hypothetical protein Tco025E_05864 [Trypanosoma conorhini]